MGLTLTTPRSRVAMSFTVSQPGIAQYSYFSQIPQQCKNEWDLNEQYEKLSKTILKSPKSQLLRKVTILLLRFSGIFKVLSYRSRSMNYFTY